MHTTMALRRKNASFSAHKEPLSGTQQQASHKEAEVFVAVVERWRDGWDRCWCGDLGDAVWRRRLWGLAGGSTTLWLPRVS